MNTVNLSSPKGDKAFALVRGMVVSLSMTFIVFFLLAALLLFASLPEWAYVTSVVITGMVSIFTGSFSTLRKIGTKGWLWGGAIGFTYYIIVWLCALGAFSSFNFSAKTLLMLVCGTVCGMIGGIVAINTGRKKKRR